MFIYNSLNSFYDLIPVYLLQVKSKIVLGILFGGSKWS